MSEMEHLYRTCNGYHVNVKLGCSLCHKSYDVTMRYEAMLQLALDLREFLSCPQSETFKKLKIALDAFEKTTPGGTTPP